MKLNKSTTDIKTTRKNRVLSLLTLIIVFFLINKAETSSAKSSNLLKANLNNKVKEKNLISKEKAQIKGIEEQDITINILNNETYFIGSAQGKIKLKQNQINVKNKNHYGGVLHLAFNETQVKNLIAEKQNNTQINLSPSNHLNDFFEYFPNFGKMIGKSEMELDLRYIWNCTYAQREESNSVSIILNLISKESATQHAFKVEFRFNSEKNSKELLRDYFENLMKICVITQKSAGELKKELHKLIVRSINIKKLIAKAGESNPANQNPGANSNGINSQGTKMDVNVFDKNPFVIGEKNNTDPINPSDAGGPVIPIPQPEIPQDSRNEQGNPKGLMPESGNSDAPAQPSAQSGESGKANNSTEAPVEPKLVNNLAKKSGKINNKVLKAASFVEIMEKVTDKVKVQDHIKPKMQTTTKPKQRLSEPNINSNPNQTETGVHHHSLATIVSNSTIIKELTPEELTDPLAKQKFQKAQNELSKNKEKLKLLEDKKKDTVKSINELYNKINSELQTKDILIPKAEMDKSKLDKAQIVIEQARQESEQMLKQSDSFLAQKKALNITQEGKIKETQALEKNFQEQKGKFDQLSQKKKDTAVSISQYNSNSELAAKKLKANSEKKNEILKQMEKVTTSIEKTTKEIEEKTLDIKATQQSFDNLSNKVEKLKYEIKLFEESQNKVSKKQDDIGKQIDPAEAEKLKKQGYEALTKLSGLEEPLANAKKAINDLVDAGVLTVIDNSYHIVLDKENNDLGAFEKEMSKIPKFVWSLKK